MNTYIYIVCFWLLFSSTLESVFRDFQQTRRELGNLFDKVETFVNNEEHKEGFQS